jgi:tagatose 1,6-diphosphate aldolase
MQTLSIGKLHGLQQCTSSAGTFTCLALDHRQNLRRALNPSDPDSVTDGDLTGFKLEVTSALADCATAVLLDPEYSAAQAVSAGVIPAETGLVVAVESTGYSGEPTARQSQILPGWSVEKSKKMGASMAKLLVYYHPDSPTAPEIEQFVQQVAEECIRNDLGLMLEPLSYSLDEKSRLTSAQKRYIVVETARRLSPLGVDILKVEFPLDITEEREEKAWVDACSEISTASKVPWILLSAAVDFKTYVRQVMVSCKAGASGIAVGRAVWQEAVTLANEARSDFLKTIARERLIRLVDLCNNSARPFADFYSTPPITPDWYKSYGIA